MKDQLITVLEAIRLSRRVLAQHDRLSGPDAETTIDEIYRLLGNQTIEQAISALSPHEASANVRNAQRMN